MSIQVIGIDPGVSGAVAVLDSKAGLVAAFDVPVAKDAGGKTRIMPAELHRLIFCHANRGDTVFVEDVHAMPGQGVSSMFSFGRALGIVEGIVGSLDLRIRYVQPATWKRRFKLIGADKDAARTVASRLYPSADLGKKKDIGKADAILIAEYGLLALGAEIMADASDEAIYQ